MPGVDGQLLTYIHILITLILILILTLILIIIQNVQHPGRSVQNRSAHYVCRTVVPGAARGYMAPSYFGRSVNPTYLKRGVDYAHQTLTVPSDFRPSYGPAMETEYYRGSLYVKTYHVTLLNTSNCLGGQLSPYATESKNLSLHSTKCATVTNKLYDQTLLIS